MSTPNKRKLDFGAVAARQVKRDVSAASQGPDRFERAQAALSGPASVLPLEAIHPRHQSTREINPEHVRSLAESIATLGLIEPIVVDQANRLLAGGHRLEAIKILRSENMNVFQRWFADGVPVRTMDFDADAVPNRALEVEVAENEHRRDYTSNQIKDLVNRLRDAGYRDTVGRPKAGEKALGPALEVIVGKSMKTIRKLLNGEAENRTRSENQPPLATMLRMLEKQRAIIPDRLTGHFDALVSGLQTELRRSQQELDAQ